jgi:hypothetical protein
MTTGVDDTQDRLRELELAFIQVNHFTESIEKLDLPAWKISVMLWQASLTAKFDTMSFWLKLMVAGAWISPVAAMVILYNLMK